MKKAKAGEEDNSMPEEIIKELVKVKTAALKKILIDLNTISQKAFDIDVNIALYQDEPIKIAIEKKREQ